MAGKEKSEWLTPKRIARSLQDNPSALRINASELANILAVSQSTISRRLANFHEDYRVVIEPRYRSEEGFSVFVELDLEDESESALKETVHKIRELFGEGRVYYLPGKNEDVLYLLRAKNSDDATKKIFSMKSLPNVRHATMVYVILEER